MRSVSLRKQKRKLLAITAALAAVGSLVLAGLYISREASLPNLVGIDDFQVPSQSDVRQDLEHYYALATATLALGANSSAAPPGKRDFGSIASSTHPTADRATEITCVYVYIDEPCCSWEHWDTRRYIRGRDLSRSRGAQRTGLSPSVCG